MQTKERPTYRIATLDPEESLPSKELSLCTCGDAALSGEGCLLKTSGLNLEDPIAAGATAAGATEKPARTSQFRSHHALTLCACTGQVYAREAGRRKAGPYSSENHRLRYRVLVSLLAIAALAVVVMVLLWGNTFPFGSEKWWRVASMRFSAVAVIATVTFAQAHATVAFQTVTNNRIITPSIMGFESLFVLVQTSIVYFLGSAGLANLGATPQFLLQVAVMVGFAVALYSWLFSGRFGNLHVMLLVGIVIGTGLGAVSTFMQRMLEPSEFDVLRARLFANVGSAKAELLPIAMPVVLIVGGAIWFMGRTLNVMALGPDVANNLGVNHKRATMVLLTFIAILMAVSTALVGPMTFLGFLTAMLAYSLTDTHDHRRILPVAWLLGVVVLGLAYLLLKHVFPMVDAVMIIVELLGGILFLSVVVRRGRL